MAKKTPVIRQMLTREGPSQEDQFFFDQDRKRNAEQRQKLRVERTRKKAAHERELHHGHCPNCGSPMMETALSGIHAEQCPSCHGVFLSENELGDYSDALISKSPMRKFARRLMQALAKGNPDWRP